MFGKKVVVFVVMFLGAAIANISGAEESPVLVSYGDIKITQDDLERYLVYRRAPDEKTVKVESAEGLERHLENLFVVKLLASKAQNVDWEQIEWQLDYQKAVWLAGIAQNEAVAEAYEGVDWDAYAKEVYMAEKERFKTSPRVHASHILISTEERDDEQALQLAQQIKARLEQGEDFAALAVEYSDDPSAQENKGDLGIFGKKRMVKPFENAVFSMTEKGQLSDPVKTRFGYHIIRLEEFFPAQVKPFEQVKEQIIKEVSVDMSVKIREQNLISARATTGIDIDRDAIARMADEMAGKNTATEK